MLDCISTKSPLVRPVRTDWGGFQLRRATISAPFSILTSPSGSAYRKMCIRDRRHSVLLPTLQRYVVQQGFSEPHEQAAVIAHELIHIESARLGAFWISGQGFDGYLASDWPPTVGRDLQLTGAEKAQLGVLYESYLLRNPATTLSNVLDELNAYSQTAGFVCLHFPAGAAKQTGPLLGHLALANAFLKASPPRDLKTTCARTVSYTHLDVYKRQRQSR